MKTLVLVYGRFQGPHIGQELMLDTAWTITQSYCSSDNPADADMIIVPTQNYNKNNPIPFAAKCDIMDIAFPEYTSMIKRDHPNGIIDIMKMYQDKYERFVLVCGSDRVTAFDRLLNTYNGVQYEYQDIQVISCGSRDGDTALSAASGTKVRAAVAARDYDTVLDLLPEAIDENTCAHVYAMLCEHISAIEETAV